MFCGFKPGSKAYKVWIPGNHKFTTSQDVIVYEEIPRVVEDDNDLQGTSREGVTSTGTQSTPTITVLPPKDYCDTTTNSTATSNNPRKAVNTSFSTTTSSMYCTNILSYLEEAGK